MSEDENNAGGSFEDRLRAARVRQGIGGPEQVPAGSAATGGGSALGVGLRVGVELVSALAVAVAIGWALDHWLRTLPLFLVIFLVLGGAAGVANVWRLVGPARRQG